MLPECRLKEYLHSVPPFSVEEDDVEDFVDELRKFHEEFSDCFAGSEPGGHFFDCVAGQLGHIERKSAEPIAVSVKGLTEATVTLAVADEKYEGSAVSVVILDKAGHVIDHKPTTIGVNL